MTQPRRGKLLLICTADAPGGMERVVLELGAALGALGWQIKVYFPESEQDGPFLTWARRVAPELGERLATHPGVQRMSEAYSRAGLRQLAALVRAERPDAVSVHYGSSYVSLQDVLAMRLGGARRVHATTHQAVAWDSIGARKRQTTGLAGRWLCRVVAICDPSVALLREAGVPASRVSKIYCGVAPSPLPADKAAARARWGVPDPAFVVVVSASLTRRKAVDEAVAACARASASPDGPPLRLVIAGDGPERAALERQAAEQMPGQVTFAGRIDGDMTALYDAGDALLLASHAEGLPLVCLEAALRGVPSVATDVGGTREGVIDGETGLLAPAGDVPALAAAVAKLRADAGCRARLGDAARARALRLFTTQAMAAAYDRELTRR